MDRPSRRIGYCRDHTRGVAGNTLSVAPAGHCSQWTTCTQLRRICLSSALQGQGIRLYSAHAADFEKVGEIENRKASLLICNGERLPIGRRFDKGHRVVNKWVGKEKGTEIKYSSFVG
jgi:hypothetical protein